MSAVLLSFGFLIVAALFASVGQAGGAGYVALMGLFGYEAADIKLTALVLTLVVAAIGVIRFQRSGHLTLRDWYPFALLGIPGALLGGAISLPGPIYRPVMAALLFAAALQMLRSVRSGMRHESIVSETPPFWPAVLAGGVAGVAAGLTGIGSGILVAPLMFWRGWAPARKVAAVSQAGNLYTAAAALLGLWATHPNPQADLPLWAIAAAIGGLFGAWLGTRHLPEPVLRYILAAILLASAAKLAFG